MTEKGERLWCPDVAREPWGFRAPSERPHSASTSFTGRFARRFPASYSSGVPRVLSLAAVSRGRLGLPPVEEARAHLQPPPLQRQEEDNLPEREVPERPVPAAAAELRRDHKVSQGMPRHAPAVSLQFRYTSLTRVPSYGSCFCHCSGFWFVLLSACLLPFGVVWCFAVTR